MLNWALRYAPIVRLVRERRPRALLEVGSGSQGLAYYLRGQPVVGTDLAFAEPIAGNLTPVRASALQLPFRANAFDTVVSSDMMEHLAEKDRAPALAEMLRVAREHLVIGFPSGADGERTDREIADELTCRGTPLPGWLTEHFEHRYPTAAALLRELPHGAEHVGTLRNSSCRVHKSVIVGETRRPWSRILRKLDSVALVGALSPWLDHSPTYREILILRKRAE